MSPCLTRTLSASSESTVFQPLGELNTAPAERFETKSFARLTRRARVRARGRRELCATRSIRGGAGRRAAGGAHFVELAHERAQLVVGRVVVRARAEAALGPIVVKILSPRELARN